jgi:hypothetical protein
MDNSEITLSLADPVVWGKCPQCTKSGRGVHVGSYFAKAFPRRKLFRSAQDVLAGEVCENCSTPLEFMYEVK